MDVLHCQQCGELMPMHAKDCPTLVNRVHVNDGSKQARAAAQFGGMGGGKTNAILWGPTPPEYRDRERATQARVVRQALVGCTRGSSERENAAAVEFARVASDYTLCILARMLK